MFKEDCKRWCEKYTGKRVSFMMYYTSMGMPPERVQIEGHDWFCFSWGSHAFDFVDRVRKDLMSKSTYENYGRVFSNYVMAVKVDGVVQHTNNNTDPGYTPNEFYVENSPPNGFPAFFLEFLNKNPKTLEIGRNIDADSFKRETL